MVAFALRSEPKRAPKRGGWIKARRAVGSGCGLLARAVGCWLGLLAVGSGCGLWARPCLPLYCCINIIYVPYTYKHNLPIRAERGEKFIVYHHSRSKHHSRSINSFPAARRISV